MANALTRAVNDFKPKPLPKINVPKKIAPRDKAPKIAVPVRRQSAY